MNNINNIKRKINFILLVILSIFYSSCETADLNLKDDPNGLTAEQADPNFLLNEIQTEFALNVTEFGRTGMEVTRMTNMFGRTYTNAYGPAGQDLRWNRAYTSILKNIRLMETRAIPKGFNYHIAIGKVIEAFTIINLVDFYGNVPYSKGFDIKNLSPTTDNGVTIYAKAISLLDEANVLFAGQSNSSTGFSDLYYGKQWSKWINLSNSLKLKIYAQTRLVDPTAIAKFNAIIATNNFIKTGSDDFQFEWGITAANPDFRHPIFVDNYLVAPGGTTDYQSIWFMDYMKNSKAISDPRMKFYFYRQVANVAPFATIEFLRCSAEPIPPHLNGYSYCSLDNGYWGRDHGNSEGIPPDGDKKTAYGLYPVGGRFDDNSYKVVTLNDGAKGDGISPIFLSSTVDFLRAELALNGGIGDAKALILAGIDKSFNKVRSFIIRDKNANLNTLPSTNLDARYISAVATEFDAANQTQKMELLSKEFFVTLFGNGIDAYNFYRRTGFPRLIQPNIEPNPGQFIRSFYYPAIETSSNPNIPQKSNVTTRVFWDNNPSTGFPVGN